MKSQNASESDTSALDSMEISRRLAFLGLDAGDAKRLRELVPAFRAHAQDFVELFYRHLFAFRETASFLEDPALVERLKASQQQHFESMLQAAWDESYVEDRRKVGLKHADVGIEPALFLGAYNQYVQFCFEDFKSRLPSPQHAELERLLSVLKAIFFDIGLTLDAYFGQSTQKLRQALDMYWKANAELKQFAQLASHDLKTPLATVANLCDEALDEFGAQMPVGARELVEAARQRTFRMSRMIDELLAFSTASDRDDDNEEISVEDAFAEALERLRPVLEAKRIEVIRGEKLPQAWGNKARLREALYNLLSNAAKFNNKPAGTIAVEAGVRDSHCLLTIADNGPGIPHEELERIFMPFRRLPMHRDVPGSGLGLYFAKNMIEHQGGRIWVESEQGAGSCFHITLKLGPDA